MRAAKVYCSSHVLVSRSDAAADAMVTLVLQFPKVYYHFSSDGDANIRQVFCRLQMELLGLVLFEQVDLG